MIAKVSLPTDPALDRQVELSISAAIAPPEAPLAQRDATLLDRSPGALTAETETPSAVTAEAHMEPNPDTTRTVRVQSGDSLSVIFSRQVMSLRWAIKRHPLRKCALATR
ncbi:MAG: hypothetical protein B7X64_07805 [Halothiobacillus sp. 39-53-45]|nr:MAG: hypothetical protein B7X64_07805 [Halothiobacillus sp. 39-53-45]